MRCQCCSQEYMVTDLVFTQPVICPFCILGHGRGYYLHRSFRTETYIQIALSRLSTPHMQHRLKCIVPSKMAFRVS